MPSVRELLEREGATVDLEWGHFERMLRRHDRKRRNQRIAAGVLVFIVALVTFIAMKHAIDTAVKPADQTHPQTFKGMVIRYTGEPYDVSGDLVAEDPMTGEVITVVDCCDTAVLRQHGIEWAASSADGGWVAFQVVSQCRDKAGGLWVTNGTNEPRPLTARCLENPAAADGTWAWSPTGSQIAVVEGGRLIDIDAATGDRTDLGEPAGDVTSLAWSPDGSRIAYGTVPAGTGDSAPNKARASVYSIDVRSGDVALLANLVGEVPGGEEGSGIQWSPDGRRLAVLGGTNDARLYLVKGDGTGAELLTEGVNVEHTLGSANLDWSPDGTRIAYAKLVEGRDSLRIWNAAPDGATPVLVFDPKGSPGSGTLSGGPVWSPDGTQIAFRYDPADGVKGWLVANADGTSVAHEIDELQYLSWSGGGYFCGCYG